jgi:hypothetical protein
VDPRHPDVVVAGANEYCTQVTTGRGWLGYYRSTDGGASWRDSLVPGDPSDHTADGQSSSTRGRCEIGSDPSVAFDAEGRLFYGFICFNRPENPDQQGFASSSTFVATYEQDGAHYVDTALVGEGSRQLDEDKINVAVDATRSAFSGNVYAAWVELAPPKPGGFPQDLLRFSRSTDHGRTFSAPIPLSDLHHAQTPDIAVGPDGSVHVAFRAGGSVFVATSNDGGKSFDNPAFVDTIAFDFDSSQFSGGSGRDCGLKPFKCASGLTFSRFDSSPTVAADASGVHVVWNDRLETGEGVVGQSKMFVRNSPDGERWTEPTIQVDHVDRGHEYFPDMVSAGGVITLVFLDSRNDQGFDPFLPPGEHKDGTSTGGAVDTYAAQSRDGGRTWTERRLSKQSSNYNLLVPGPVPFWGDYIYVSAAKRTVMVAWTDSRDVAVSNHGTGGKDGFHVFEPCLLGKQFINDPCLSQGGHDQNIYAARL